MGQVDLAALRAHVEGGFDAYVDALRQMVDTDCGTYTPGGVNLVADRCAERFAALGFRVERHGHRPGPGEPQLGDCLVGRSDGAADAPRVLLIGHMDTVFGEGTAAERPFRIEGSRAHGPGVSDMKCGLLGGFLALEALGMAGAPTGPVTYVCNPDEEIGSTFSKPIIEASAREADVCFVLESARENGNIVSARKGIADVRLEVAGRAAHAGVEPRRGRNAILEAAHKVLALQALNGRWPGVTVNVGVISGGTRPNVVPERCELEVDIRSPDEASFAEAEAEVRRIAGERVVPDTTVDVRVAAAHRPMERSEAGVRLVALARAVAGELGFDVEDTATGGASDANTTAALGVPTLDGLGPVGGGAHGRDEWLDLSSVVDRVTLLAGVIARSGEALSR